MTTKKEIVKWLKQNDVYSLEGLTDKMATTLDKNQLRAMRQTVKETDTPITKQMLQLIDDNETRLTKANISACIVPFELDGTLYDPEDANKFKDKNLRFYIDNDLIEKGCLKAFSTKKALVDFLTETKQITPFEEKKKITEIPASYSHVPGTPSWFYEHANFGGASISMGYRHALWNLEEHTLSGWWFWRVSWNDKISSIITANRALWCYENAAMQGNYLTVGRNTRLNYVGGFWNDRISCVIEALN